MKGAAQTKMEADAKDNEAKGKAYRDTFAKEKGVKPLLPAGIQS